MKPIQPPPEVKDDPQSQAIEVCRVWLDDGSTWVSFAEEMESEAALETWGPILADVAATIVAHMPKGQSADWRKTAFAELASSFSDHLKMRL